MFLRRPPRLSVFVRGAKTSLAVLSGTVHRGSLANAQGALFERRQHDLDNLRTWRELEPRLQAGGPAPSAGETA